ncbi:DUF4397 domain-containing protein [Algoriphagus limi]|uniref:DUF4397 domain-containing protein n=1 Tax=Algoriphagus limi TaxID=2975273 RepID=A0ABT2G3K4_9BACT|nr:DUF4397 domain-containing protein [Algoriphagus limi]MCS5489845.1 DUF4397 domain-containing protein [Algoriphagus limi]
MIKSTVTQFHSFKIKLAAFASIAILGTSCLNDIDTPVSTPAAYVSIYQSSPDAPDMEIFADANRVTSQPLGFSEFIAYSPFFTGERLFRFLNSLNGGTLLEKNFQLEVDEIYSVFVLDHATSLDAKLVKDGWEDPKADFAQIRFAHLSPDAGEVYVEFSELETPISPNTVFKDVTGFIEVETGTYDILIKSVENGETIMEISEVEIREKNVYTLLLRGLYEEPSNPNSLDLQLITNYFDL